MINSSFSRISIMKITILVSLVAMTVTTVLSGMNSAEAETISGKVAAITKGSKSTAVEISPSSSGTSPSYRYSISTTFQEIADMLLQAMEAKTSVTIVSSGNCAPVGNLRDCGSIVSVEAAKL
jgi:hypothetical protein